MRNIMFIHSPIICNAPGHIDIMCDDCCRLDNCDVLSYQQHLSCPNALECKERCLVTNTDSVDFSGVTYDTSFNPVWRLTLANECYDSRHSHLTKLAIDDDVIYDVTRDDVGYWFDHNREVWMYLLELRLINDGFDGDAIEDYCRIHNVVIPCSGDMLCSFFAMKIPAWSNRA